MIIVTGAAGFIGSCLVRELNHMGRKDIICVDRLGEDQKWLNLRGLKYNEYIQADDFINGEAIYQLFDEETVEAVYHMGACSSTTERDMDFLMYNNVDYSKILFQVCSENNTPFCYASSAATYGSGEQGYNDDHSKIASLLPLNAYGYSKQLVDEWAINQSVTPDRWYGLKFFNVYGPNEYHKEGMSSVAYQTFKQIKETGKMKLFKSYKDGVQDGEQLRDFVYVKDVARAMISLVNDSHNGASGIYNMGTGVARSFYDLAASTFKAMDLAPEIDFIDMPESLRGQYQYYTQAQMHKLQKALPQFNFHTLEEGVKDYVKEHLLKDNPYYV